jgi:hypothetical protein
MMAKMVRPALHDPACGRRSAADIEVAGRLDLAVHRVGLPRGTLGANRFGPDRLAETPFPRRAVAA